jgi:hypothetical protein
MSNNNPYETIAKTMAESAAKFKPEALQAAIKPAQDNLKAWADLAQKQAKEVQAALTESVESMKTATDPQSAFEAFKASAEAGMALFTKNLKEATSLSVGQFNSTVDAIEKAHPAPEAFASVAKNLKTAASNAESAVHSTLEKGVVAKAKKSK